jgi:thiamine biosynthesis lipoprotein
MRDRPTLRRRDVIALGAGAFVVAALPFATRSRRRAYRRTLPVMGTIADLAVVTDDAGRAHAALDAAAAELRRVDALMSRYRADSDVGRANAAAGRDVTDVSPATAYVLREALAWAERTDGRFDPCLGRLSEAYSPSKSGGASKQPALWEGGDAPLYRELDLGRHGGRDVARLATPAALLDLGGIAKGHAVDRALAAIREHGIEDGFVNAGGDLAAAGSSADGDAWRVGIRDPADPFALCGTLDLRDEAVATSGDYETARRVGDAVVHHLLDPRTGRPRPTGEGTHSLTIVAPTCLTADAAATALFGMAPGSADTSRLLRGTGARIAGRA